MSVRCEKCDFCGMDMDLEPYCVHPQVLKTNSYGSNCNVVRGAKLCEGDTRLKLPHYNLCGQEAKLWEIRKRRGA